jgi:hypothetical protein
MWTSEPRHPLPSTVRALSLSPPLWPLPWPRPCLHHSNPYRAAVPTPTGGNNLRLLQKPQRSASLNSHTSSRASIPFPRAQLLSHLSPPSATHRSRAAELFQPPRCSRMHGEHRVPLPDFVATYASSATHIQRNEPDNCWCSDAHVLSNLTKQSISSAVGPPSRDAEMVTSLDTNN